MYSVDRNDADRNNRGSLKNFDGLKKVQCARDFYLIFCQRAASTFAKPHEVDPLTKALQKSLLFPSSTYMLITFLRIIYEDRKEISTFGQIMSK